MARQLAASATSLEELREKMASFDGCNLKFTAKNLVFADGNPQADIMFVGEAPGRDEDLEGRPFVGRSGQLLDRMLAAIGLDGVLSTSPMSSHGATWQPRAHAARNRNLPAFIERQIELVAPKVLVHLGGPRKTLSTPPKASSKAIGHHSPHRGQPYLRCRHCVPYLPGTPAHKRLAWRDFLQ